MRIIIICLMLLVSIPALAKWENVVQEWQPYFDKMAPDQQDKVKKWFNAVRPKRAGPACCAINDGHPTQADHRTDGWYIPNPFHTDWDWVKVPDDAFTVPGTNPMGIAIVWYGTEQSDGTPYIRCFVPESET